MIDKLSFDQYLQGILEQHNIAGMSVAVTDRNGDSSPKLRQPYLLRTYRLVECIPYKHVCLP